MLGGACYHCGVQDDPIIYDLHHRNPEDKEHNIGGILAWNLSKIQAEVAKCDLLCANCHRKLHRKLRGQ